MKRRKERLHTYVVKSEKVAPDVLETPWIGSSKYEVSFLYAWRTPSVTQGTFIQKF